MTVGSCCVCGKYCSPAEEIIVRPCYHTFHIVCYANLIGSGESVMYCPKNKCRLGRPPFCGGCYGPIYCDESSFMSLPCGHHFHRPCYEGKRTEMNLEHGSCISTRCIPLGHREPEGKRALAESEMEVVGNEQTGGNYNGASKNKRIRTKSS